MDGRKLNDFIAERSSIGSSFVYPTTTNDDDDNDVEGEES
jgi:hypothetical protein